MRIVAIDFEASCLPCHGRSFPIEVGIAETSAAARSWLIRPHAAWRGWDWTAEAERLHGISHQRLLAEGGPVDAVVSELVEAIGDARVFADSHLDAAWMGTLARAAGVPPIAIGHVEELVARAGASDEELRKTVEAADRLPVGRHRAGDDARWLRGLIDGLLALPRPSIAEAPLFGWDQGRRVDAGRHRDDRIATPCA